MKRLLISFALLLAGLYADAQQITDKLRINDIKGNIVESCENISNLKCNYIQEKSVSLLEDDITYEGEVIFVAPNILFWNNKKTGNQEFILKNDSVKIVNDNGVNIMPIEEHMIFREISKIINNGVSNKSIIDENNFLPAYEENEDYIIVNMKPKKNKMKSVLGNMILHFDKSSYLIHKIEIIDNNYDLTTITLSDIHINQDVDKTLFNF